MCQCEHPLVTVTADIYARNRPKKNGLYTVDRCLDCLFCGPHIERMEVADIPAGKPDAWTKGRPTFIVQPARLVKRSKRRPK